MSGERRDGKRVRFEHGFSAHMMAIDGTWRRECKVVDVSESGAQLSVPSLAGLQLAEFFLLFTSIGVAYRRCRLVWVNGESLGVAFISHGRGKDVKRKNQGEQFV
jgi:hypothetical protein